VTRRKTKKIKVGKIYIGGNAPISVQSMCDTDTRNIKATVKQIRALERTGCDLIRVAVPDIKAALALGKIKKQTRIPLVADIHFDYKLALIAIEQGIDKLRINPGNIGSEEKIKQLIALAKKKKIPIRIGVNGGSLEKDILKKHQGKVTAQAMVESALRHIKILERNNFRQILISLKANDIARTVEAYQLLAPRVNYPFHLGITEAGTKFVGTIKSAIGLGVLLTEGIGDTIRVSLTAEPLEEIKVGREILKALDLLNEGCRIISCPTCGRTEFDIKTLTERIENETKKIKKPLRIAIMGCIVNGPGEAREADVGVAMGKTKGVIFRQGKIIDTAEKEDIFEKLMIQINKLK
jgi:(E)-4-hydroxy-3-methylbut-2-enyl-diphosphate synthase